MSKKIAIITDAYEPQINGVVTTIKNIRKHLLNRNYCVEIVSFNDSELNLPLLFYPEIKIPINIGTISKKIEKINPDAIHITTEFIVGLTGLKYCKANNIKFTTSYHTNWDYIIKKIMPVIPEKIIFSYLKNFHNSGCCTLVTNRSMKMLLDYKGFKNTRIWHRGVDRTIFNPDRKTDIGLNRPIFLYVGRISLEKNLEDFLSLELPGTKLVIGDGPLLKTYEKKYSDIVFLGSKKNEELAKYYASSDVFVFPSKFDTFGLVLIEAMSCGLPLVAYDVTGPNEIIENNVNGFLCKNKDDFGKKILMALDINRDNVLKCSEKWTWEKATDIFLSTMIFRDQYI